MIRGWKFPIPHAKCGCRTRLPNLSHLMLFETTSRLLHAIYSAFLDLAGFCIFSDHPVRIFIRWSEYYFEQIDKELGESYTTRGFGMVRGWKCPISDAKSGCRARLPSRSHLMLFVTILRLQDAIHSVIFDPSGFGIFSGHLVQTLIRWSDLLSDHTVRNFMKFAECVRTTIFDDFHAWRWSLSRTKLRCRAGSLIRS